MWSRLKRVDLYKIAWGSSGRSITCADRNRRILEYVANVILKRIGIKFFRHVRNTAGPLIPNFIQRRSSILYIKKFDPRITSSFCTVRTKNQIRIFYLLRGVCLCITLPAAFNRKLARSCAQSAPRRWLFPDCCVISHFDYVRSSFSSMRCCLHKRQQGSTSGAPDDS